MSVTSKKSGALIAAAAAGLILSGCASQGGSTMAMSGDSVHCAGVNSCKGKTSCKSAKNNCKGQNSCKGQGWLSKGKSECDAEGGTVI